MPKIDYLWTYFILASCLLVGLASRLGNDLEVLQPFLITSFDLSGGYLFVNSHLEQSFGQQWWRLITPAVVHFGVMHLIFNLLWWWQLGTLLERTYGTFYFMGLFLILAASSNVAQYWASGPLFGGLSGVVYGLLAYIYGRSLGDRQFFQLKPEIVWFMLAWYFICWSGLVGNVANIAHTVGLLVGLVLGLVVNLMRKFKARSRH